MLSYRYLFSQLVRRELRQKYKGSALGVLWYLVNPLVLMGAYTLMFGFVLNLQGSSRPHPYPIFLMIGIVVWTFFAQSLLSAAPSLIEQGGLVRKARFPREVIPGSAVTVQLITFAALLVLLVPIALALCGSVSPALLLLPVLVALLFAFTLGCALIVAVLHAYFRDIAPIVAAALLPWFFITPIFFVANELAPVQRHPFLGTLLDWVNPIAPFMLAIREILFYGRAPELGQLLYTVVAAVVVLGLGRAVFVRMEGELAVIV
ncbi:MAG TPA: ABC transporter permease [Solirubrobacteraceae bacterium]|jgi:ABC-type polysaccharide/polyol phosphate export permease|nr:ABC transporter permease [Solirubrobacteraceae bacterium]